MTQISMTYSEFCMRIFWINSPTSVILKWICFSCLKLLWINSLLIHIWKWSWKIIPRKRKNSFEKKIKNLVFKHVHKGKGINFKIPCVDSIAITSEWQSSCFWLSSDIFSICEKRETDDRFLGHKMCCNKSRCKHFRSTF